MDLEELHSLPVSLKIELVERLWDDIAAEVDGLPVAKWQLDEIRQRKAAAEDDPNSLLSEEDFWQQVDGK